MNAARGFTRVIRIIIRCCAPVYYWFKTLWRKLLVGDEAAATVLYDAMYPDIVLRLFGASIGCNVRISRWLMIHEAHNDFSKLRIGDDVHIGKNVFIDLTEQVCIGDRVTISMFCRVLTHQNFGDSLVSQQYPPISNELIIPDDIVLGSSVTLLCQARLVSGCIVAAGSVVRDVFTQPAVIGGVPARLIKPIVDNAQHSDTER